MIRRTIERNLERSLQIYDRNENKKTNLTQKEETAPKPSSRTPGLLKLKQVPTTYLALKIFL